MERILNKKNIVLNRVENNLFYIFDRGNDDSIICIEKDINCCYEDEIYVDIFHSINNSSIMRKLHTIKIFKEDELYKFSNEEKFSDLELFLQKYVEEFYKDWI